MMYYIVPFLFIRCLTLLFTQGATAHIEASGWLPGQPKEAEFAAASFRTLVKEATQLLEVVSKIFLRSVVLLVQLEGRLRPHHLGRAVFLCRICGASTMRIMARRNNKRLRFGRPQDGKKGIKTRNRTSRNCDRRWIRMRMRLDLSVYLCKECWWYESRIIRQ